MSRPRMLEPGYVCEATIVTVDRQFLFTPDHSLRPGDSPLLVAGCPREALHPDSDLVPRSSSLNLIGAAAARAQRRHRVRLHALEGNTNHLHSMTSGRDEHEVARIPHFYRDLHALVARGINAKLEREGHVFARRYRLIQCQNDFEAERHLRYALTNVVKDGLVERVSESPLFSTYGAQVRGEELWFWYIDKQAWFAAGRDPRPQAMKRFLHWVPLEISPLPHLAALPEHRRRTRVRKLVETVELFCDEARRGRRWAAERAVPLIGASGAASDRAGAKVEGDDAPAEPGRPELEYDGGARVLGARGIASRDPRGRPESPRVSRPAPACHATTRAELLAYLERRRAFEEAYREASRRYRAGELDVVFPVGSFRPPLIRMITSDEQYHFGATGRAARLGLATRRATGVQPPVDSSTHRLGLALGASVRPALRIGCAFSNQNGVKRVVGSPRGCAGGPWTALFVMEGGGEARAEPWRGAFLE